MGLARIDCNVYASPNTFDSMTFPMRPRFTLAGKFLLVRKIYITKSYEEKPELVNHSHTITSLSCATERC